MALKFVNEAEIEGKKVIARFDFNVPIAKDGTTISDTTRIDLALKTIKFILEQKPDKLVLMSHLGRPKGMVNKKFSLEPVAKYLAEKLEEEVILSESASDAGVKTLLNLSGQKIILLENLRFSKEEELNDPEFSKLLASYGEVYINDAFGTAHRKHASTYGIVKYFKNESYAGFLIQREMEALKKVSNSPAKPFVAVVGGSKISDKIKIIEKLLSDVDELLIGGAMAYPFLKAKGYSVGKSLCNEYDVALAKKILSSNFKNKIVLPCDHITSTKFDGSPETCNDINIGDDQMGLDIGIQTREVYWNKLTRAKTILWNGPMGVFENDDFNKGTMAIAKTLSELEETFTLVGGGDSVSAVNKSGLARKMSHVSTGGGASLEFIEKGSLPGIQALKFGVND